MVDLHLLALEHGEPLRLLWDEGLRSTLEVSFFLCFYDFREVRAALSHRFVP